MLSHGQPGEDIPAPPHFLPFLAIKKKKSISGLNFLVLHGNSLSNPSLTLPLNDFSFFTQLDSTLIFYIPVCFLCSLSAGPCRSCFLIIVSFDSLRVFLFFCAWLFPVETLKAQVLGHPRKPPDLTDLDLKSNCAQSFGLLALSRSICLSH